MSALEQDEQDVSARPVKRARLMKGSSGAGSWDDYKEEIYALYAVQNCSLEDLMTRMAGKGLKAS